MIIASMCTIPERKDSFRQVVCRILHEQTRQVDRLYVWLNGYKQEEDDLPQDPRLVYFLEPANPGPWKRYCLNDLINEDDMVLTLDDDLIYPSDYVERGIRALERYRPSTSVCFAGAFWDGVVPRESQDFYLQRRLIPYPGELGFNSPITVIMGGAGFHHASVVKDLVSAELPGFATNDDLMASFNLQKQGYQIKSIAKPESWIQDHAAQNAEHALWRRDASTRVETFKAMVTELDFIPWREDKQDLKQAPSCLLVSIGEINETVLAETRARWSSSLALHTLEIIEGGLGRVSSRPLRPHEEHFVSLPAEGGRFESIPSVKYFRDLRVQSSGWTSVKQYLEWLDNALTIQQVIVLSLGGPNWLDHKLHDWAQDRGHPFIFAE